MITVCGRQFRDPESVLSYMKGRGISQVQVAGMLGVGKQYVTDVKNGRKPWQAAWGPRLTAKVSAADDRLARIETDQSQGERVLGETSPYPNRHRYQSMPDMTEDEYERLKTSIQEKGLLQPIVVDGNGDILDGHHRWRACNELGVTPETVVKEGLSEAQKLTYAATVNIERRHLTQAQKRELIERLLEADPTMSDREVARATQTSPTTVGKMRAKSSTASATVRRTRDGRTMDTSRIGHPEADTTTAEMAEGDRSRLLDVDQAIGVSIGSTISQLRKADLNLPQQWRLIGIFRDGFLHYVKDMDEKEKARQVAKIQAAFAK